MPGRPRPSSTSSSSSSSSPPPPPAAAAPPSANHSPQSSTDVAVLRRFHDITVHARQVQSSLLHSILRHNLGCDYLRRFQIPELPSSEDSGEQLVAAFRKSVPLVSHADIKPYIDRITDGGRAASANILTAAPVDALCLSSGTTDAKQKYLLYHEGLSSGTLEVASIAAAFRHRVYPLEEGGRILEFLFSGKLVTTNGGLKAGTASTHMIQSHTFKQRQLKNGLRSCSPNGVASSSSGDYREAMYCHLLSGLVHCHQVQVLSAPFAFTLVEALRTLESQWPRLCADIAAGALLPPPPQHVDVSVTDPYLRRCMQEEVLVTPKPALAAQLEATFRSLAATSWRGAVAALWPRCKYVLSIFTGAMEPYAQQLQRRYLDATAAGWSPPLVCADYGATEGWIGVNIDPTSPPSDVRFTIPPSLAFFEFIPLTKRSVDGDVDSCSAAAYEEGEAVGMCDVEVGREYELVMTTAWGLYRYRLGDIVRVTGFYNGAPQVSYVCRKNVMLSLSIDKVTEKDLEMAVERARTHLAEAELGLQVADYSSYADRSTTPGHYVVFCEVGSSSAIGELSCKMDTRWMMGKGGKAAAALEGCAAALEASLKTEPGYATARKMGSIGALELRVVRSGSFAKVLELALARGSTISQYKTPRCLASKEALELLRSATIAIFFSESG